MSEKVIGLRAALGLARGTDIGEYLFARCSEVLGTTRTEWEREWRPATPADHTARGHVSESAAELVETWYRDRDPGALYSNPKFLWDILSNSVYQTSQTTVNGIRILKRLGFEPATIMDFGAGPGMSSIILAKNFDRALVYFVELSEECAKVMRTMADHPSCDVGGRVIRTTMPTGPAAAQLDMLVALESVEVFREYAFKDRPVGTLRPWWDMTNYVRIGGFVMEHTTWSAEKNGYPTLSYYPEYAEEGVLYPAHKMKSPFRRGMMLRGFEIVGEGWNASPTVWRRYDLHA